MGLTTLLDELQKNYERAREHARAPKRSCDTRRMRWSTFEDEAQPQTRGEHGVFSRFGRGPYIYIYATYMHMWSFRTRVQLMDLWTCEGPWYMCPRACRLCGAVGVGGGGSLYIPHQSLPYV
eukprot:scaffold2072_cov126-Isochrysis_galbana.AAC.19